MDSQIRDSAFESVDVDEDGGEAAAGKKGDTSYDLLEQQQAREQARLLHRFRELRQMQQMQQDQLMHQQQLQLEMLKGEQLRVQTLIASQRGAQWGDGRVSRPETAHKSPPLMTPPRRSGLGGELAHTMMAAMPPHASADSGLVASMGDTLDPPKGGLPRPVMIPTSPSGDDDKYTNPELFSNPGSHSDDLQAIDDRLQFMDGGSEVGSDNFYLPPLPPEPKDMQPDMTTSLKTLQTLLATADPNTLQQMLGFLPAQQKSLLLEQRQAAIQESASPTFTPIQPHVQHPSVPPAPTGSAAPAFSGPPMGFQSTGGVFVPQNFAQPLNFTQPLNFSVPPSLTQSQGLNMNVRTRLQSQAPSQGVPLQAASLSSSLSHTQRQMPPVKRSVPVSSDSYHHPVPVNSEQPSFGVQRPSQQTSHPPQWPAQPTSHLQQRPSQPTSHPPQWPAQPTSHLQQRPSQPTSHVQLRPSLQTSHPQPRPSQLTSHPQQEQMEQVHHRPSPTLPQPQSKPVSSDSQVKTRLSWEDEGDVEQEWTGREFSGSEREDEDEEELEVTVKAAVTSPEDRPITSGLQGRKTFEQLLEEQLADEEERNKEEQRRKEQQTTGPVKRPFLRKGQGTARFSQPIKRPPPKRPSAHKTDMSRGVSGGLSGGGGVSSEDRPVAQQARTSAKLPAEKRRVSAGVGKKQTRDEDPPQPEKLTLIKRRSETGRKMQTAPRVQSTDTQHRQTSIRIPQSEELEEDVIADDASFIAGLKEREKKAPLEAEELDEFEALEDIADNMSLVSNSSVVQRLITPNKQRQKSAVSDLKTVLEKKKNASSPFERNTAIRSLLSVNIPCPPISQSQEREQTAERPSDDNDDTLVEDEYDSDHHFRPVDDGRAAECSHQQYETQNTLAASDIRNTEGAVKNVVNHTQAVNGMDFSKQFSMFDQYTQPAQASDSSHGGLSSPTKSVTRKVATLQSRLNAANDTAALLQKLSAHAGFLSSGMSQADAADMKLKTGDEEESNDTSLLSSSVSRPQPVVIGGKKGNDYHSGYSSGQGANAASDDDDQSDSTVEENDDDDDKEVSDGEDKVIQGSSSLPSDIPGAGHAMSNNNNNNNVNNNNDDDDDQNVDWEDEEEWTCNVPQVSENQVTSQPGSEVTESTPPTSKLMSRLFPKLKPKPTAAQQQQQQKMQMASTSVGDGIQSKVLREKLAELEAEIEKFRTENASLERLRREREEGVNKLKEEIAHFDQEKTNELRRLEEFKAQETKKLKHERKLFETYQKQVRSMPDKKDREEIETLRRQLSDLQDEMKRKESRWTSSTTRLKTRITELEGENAELREEMKLLERKRLEWMQTHSTQRPAQAQPSAVIKSAPRSSTPTNDNTIVSNGFHDNSNRSRGAAHPSVSSGPVAMTTHMNGAGAAGKSSTGSGGHSGSGGESMPREQPATPSMIEGVSPAVMSNSGEGSDSFMAAKTATSSRAIDRPTVDKGSGQYEETQYSDGKVERVYSNGSREVLFANGTRKEISSDGQYFIVSFFNGDIKQVFPDQRVVYYYAESQTTHTTYPDRLEVLQFPNNQTEKHYPDGTHEITFPNQTVKYLFPSGTEESIFPDGTILRIDKNGEKVLEFPNGQREIHTQQLKRREYPDGTVKTLHNDGRQETRYATGRVRLKDKDGNVLMDRMC